MTHFERSIFTKTSRMSRIDYSKWDKLNYSSSSSSEEDDDEKEKTQKARGENCTPRESLAFCIVVVVLSTLERVGVAS